MSKGRERYWAHSDPEPAKHGGAKLAKHGRPECAGCGRPVADGAFLCAGGKHGKSCTGALREHLEALPFIIDELAVTYTRATRTDDGGGSSKSAQTSLPWSDKASDALRDVHGTLAIWVHLVVTQRTHVPHHGPTCRHCDHPSCERIRLPRVPRNDPLSASRWLLAHLEWLRHHQSSPRLLTELERRIKAINYVMDLRAERFYAGPCMSEYHHGDCPCRCHRGGHCDGDDCYQLHTEVANQPDACCLMEIYAKPKAEIVQCRSCKTPLVVADRRAWLLAQAEDQLAHAELIGRALSSMGEAVTPAMIRGYAARGRIVPHGQRIIEGKECPLYRVGDVIAVVREVGIEQARKASVRAARHASKPSKRAC